MHLHSSSRMARSRNSAAVSGWFFAPQSNLYRKEHAGSSISFFCKFTDPLLKFVASALKGVQLLALASGNYRIVNTPMQSPGGAGKDRTSLVRVIADGNPVIQFSSEKFVRRL